MDVPQNESSPSAPARLHEWFTAEVQPHDASLKAYLRGSFPSVRDVDDVVQESYLRMWKARTVRPIQSVRAFLFRVARNLAVDLVRREQAVPMTRMGSLDCLSVLDDRPGAIELLTHEEKGRLLGQSLAELPDRCREIVFLHKIKGLPQRMVAERLGLSEKTVANQIALGVKRCEEFFQRRGIEFF